jgi:hypothetical protein
VRLVRAKIRKKNVRTKFFVKEVARLVEKDVEKDFHSCGKGAA